MCPVTGSQLLTLALALALSSYPRDDSNPEPWTAHPTATALASGAAQSASVQTKETILWPEGAPGAAGNGDADRPSLLLFVPPAVPSPRSAVVVCPGGGYAGLALDYEGAQVAEWLNAQGLAAFVLKYRHAPRYHHPAPLLDAQRALRYVRWHASEFGVAPDRIGIWGFSAGGHLAATAATHFDAGDPGAADSIDRVSSRPDFLILAYPVISCVEPYAHVGSCQNLLGEHPEPGLGESVSNERQVTARTPPAFLFHTSDDNTVPPENSVAFYLALRKAGVPAELHVYTHGRHGVGLALNDPVLSSWVRRLAEWLRARGLLPASPPPSTTPSAATPKAR